MLGENQLRAIKSGLGLMIDDDSNRAALTESQLADAKNALISIDALLDGNTIADYWSLEDVFSALDPGSDEPEDPDADPYELAKDRSELSDEQARDILREVDQNRDASIGINWDTIRDTASNYLSRNES